MQKINGWLLQIFAVRLSNKEMDIIQYFLKTQVSIQAQSVCLITGNDLDTSHIQRTGIFINTCFRLCEQEMGRPIIK